MHAKNRKGALHEPKQRWLFWTTAAERSDDAVFFEERSDWGGSGRGAATRGFESHARDRKRRRRYALPAQSKNGLFNFEHFSPVTHLHSQGAFHE